MVTTLGVLAEPGLVPPAHTRGRPEILSGLLCEPHPQSPWWLPGSYPGATLEPLGGGSNCDSQDFWATTDYAGRSWAMVGVLWPSQIYVCRTRLGLYGRESIFFFPHTK